MQFFPFRIERIFRVQIVRRPDPDQPQILARNHRIHMCVSKKRQLAEAEQL